MQGQTKWPNCNNWHQQRQENRCTIVDKHSQIACFTRETYTPLKLYLYCSRPSAEDTISLVSLSIYFARAIAATLLRGSQKNTGLVILKVLKITNHDTSDIAAMKYARLSRMECTGLELS